jgi:hypothetical protein
MMPYRIEVLAKLKGLAASEAMLPMSGNRIGDTFVVGRTPWIWLVAPGAGRPTWVDP